MSAFVKKKSVVLVVVMGIAIVIASLCIGTAYLLSQQARISGHRIRRIRAYYAAMAGVAYAFDRLRNSTLPSGNSSLPIGNGIYGYPPGGFTVNIDRDAGSGVDGTDKITVNVDYAL